MALNDQSLNAGGRGVDVYPGVANPISSSDTSNPMQTNMVEDPTTDDLGAGASDRFDGHEQAQRNFRQTASVVEGRPGIIESANIDPLNENSNKDDGWANARSTSGVAANAANKTATTTSSMTTGATTMASGAAQYAYGTATGDEAAKKAGKEAVFGK